MLYGKDVDVNLVDEGDNVGADLLCVRVPGVAILPENKKITVSEHKQLHIATKK